MKRKLILRLKVRSYVLRTFMISGLLVTLVCMLVFHSPSELLSKLLFNQCNKKTRQQCNKAFLFISRFENPNVVFIAKGDLGSRLKSLCASYVLAKRLNANLKVVWRSDKWLPLTRFDDLFENTTMFAIVEDILNEFKLSTSWSRWKEKAETYVDHCDGWNTIPDPPSWKEYLSPPKNLFVEPSVSICSLRDSLLKLKEDEAVNFEMRKCYQSLEVSPQVQNLLESLNLNALRRCAGVFSQSGAPFDSLQYFKTGDSEGDAGKGPLWLQDLLKNKEKTKELMQNALREKLPNITNLALDEESEVENDNTWEVPDEGNGVRKRKRLSRKLKSITSPETVWFEGNQTSETEEDVENYVIGRKYNDSTMANTMKDEEDDLNTFYPNITPETEKNRCFGGSRIWKDDASQIVMAMVQASLISKDVCFFLGGSSVKSVSWILGKLSPNAKVERLGFQNNEMEDLCSGTLGDLEEGLPIWSRETIISAKKNDRLALVACAQRQLAEMIALQHTNSLIHMHPSGETEFITSRGTMKKFDFEKPLCEKRIPPLKKQTWTKFVDVDENHRILYCAMPKIACTTYRTWLRRIRGLPDLPEPELIHKRSLNGLTVLYFHYTESQISQILTDPKFFRFAFVRNPWNRILSAYLDKHVLGGVVERDRHKWNRRFFRALGPKAIPSQDSDGLMSFHKFISNVGEMINKHREELDEHVAPQMDLCALDRLKFDYLGKFESLYDDTQELGRRLQAQGREIKMPDLKQSAHSTNSEKKLVEHFDGETIMLVRKVYSMDMSFPLNKVHFLPPVILRSSRKKKPR